MDLISVIVPIYNREKYIERCISSIINQTYKQIEIVLVDDGSDDATPSICTKWGKKDQRIKYIYQGRRGVSTARNSGVEQAKGKYIMMVDSDDYISDHIIEILYHQLQKYHVLLSMCDFLRGSEEDYTFKITNDYGVELISGTEAIKRSYIDSHNALRYISPCWKLIDKSLYEGIKYPDGKIFEDIYVTHQLLYKADKIAVVDQKLVYYYQHPDSIMNKEYHAGKLDYLDASKQRISFFQERGLTELASIAYDEYLHSLIWEYSRARDLLADKKIMEEIKSRFREIYRDGYSNQRYESENARFLHHFYKNPERIIWYWRISAKLKGFKK